MTKVRKDNKGRNLRTGETQRSDGSYMFVYKLGKKKKYIYDTDLAALRAKEKQITKDADDGIRTQEAMKLTLNDMFKVYMDNNIRLKPSTRANYEYLWDRYVKDEPFANEPLPNVRRSDVLGFYTKLLKHGFAINSLESINTIVHPAFELAVADDYIRKNPSKGIYTKLKTDGSAPKPKKRIALTKAQQKNFLQYIARSPMYSHWLPVMVTLLGTGLRVASRREAMMRKRQTFYFDLDPDGMYRVYEGRIVQARVIAVAEKVVRVEVFGVECSILARDLAWDWIGDAHERFAVGDEVLVRILSVRRNSLEDLGIRADIKSTSENTDRDNLQKCRIQGKYAGKVTDVHKGVVYVRLANGVNAVAHSCYDYRMPGKKDDVSFAVTRLDMERGVAVGIITRIIRQNL